jgi:hypothetical protein
LGFFDEDDNIYIVERLSFMFKYTSIFVTINKNGNSNNKIFLKLGVPK